MDIRKRSRLQENRTAKQFRGKTLPGSGCIDNMKGDVRSDNYLIENKYTTSSYTLKKTTWEKIRKEAIRDGMRDPLLQLDFVISELETYSFIIFDFNLLDQVSDIIFVQKLFKENKSFTINFEDILPYLQYEEDFCWSIDIGNTRLAMIRLEDFLEKEGILQ